MNALRAPRKQRIYNVMTAPKDTFLQIRIREDVKRDLQKVAELRGLSMSALIHSLIVKSVREEKEREPGAFKVGALVYGGVAKNELEDVPQVPARKLKTK